MRTLTNTQEAYSPVNPDSLNRCTQILLRLRVNDWFVATIGKVNLAAREIYSESLCYLNYDSYKLNTDT
jgi:hypothetical protein